MTKKITLILYLLLILMLAIATLVEHARGTAFVTEHIYHSVPFILLWGVMGVLLVVAILKREMWRVWQNALLHASFLLILAGALTTYLTSSKGIMHLRMGTPSSQYIEEGKRTMRDLPFTLVLDTFRIDYYPGTDAPSDYVSRVKIAPSNFSKERESNADNDVDSSHCEVQEVLIISMNNVLDHEGFRFYQSSYDEDRRGTWLSVNYDPWGTGVTYAGYALLFFSMVVILLNPQGGFRRLLKHPMLKKGGTALLLFLWGVHSGFAQYTKPLPIIPLEEAEEKREMQVIYHDRVVPLNTLARDFVKKLYGKESFSGLSPEQILLSWQNYPQEWAYVPAIRIKNVELRQKLGIEGNYARMVDLFAQGDYRMRQWWEPDTDGGKPTPLQKTIIETDEKVALVMMLQNGTLIRPIPQDGSIAPLSRAKLKAELLYNDIPFTKILFMFNLTMGMLMQILLLIPAQRKGVKQTRSLRIHSFLVNKVGKGFSLLFLLSLLFALLGYLLRWYIGGRIPLSNGYETMQFLSVCIMALALFLSRRFRPAFGFGFLLSGFTLLVAYLGQMNPQITPLIPVLVSPWLSLHVSVIMMAYALFAFILLNGVWALCQPREAEWLMTYSRLLLYPALFLLTAGIFIGAIWANVSWGRYWGWDPKEVWALITMLIYAMPLHGVSLPLFRKPKFFHTYLIIAFLSVLITYFGVNFFLGGMHSYA